jgi:hypothetical protein
MSRYEHIKIFQCAYILAVEIYKTSKNFSKEYKYTLGENLKNSVHGLLDIIMRTNALSDNEKMKFFPEIDFKKEHLRVYVRIAFDLNVIGPGQFKILNEKIEEVGRQLGGWQKYTAKQNGLAV